MKKMMLTLVILTTMIFGQDSENTVNVLGKNVSTAKRELIATNILIKEQAKLSQFWEIYNEYDKWYSKASSNYKVFLMKYSSVAMNMSKENADRIAKELLSIEKEKSKLTKKYYKQIRSKVSPVVATRFLQIENRLNLLEDFQTASNFPLALPDGAQSGKRVVEVTVE